MKKLRFLWGFVYLASAALPCSAQNLCSVTSLGAKGDCTTNDTAAFQEAADRCGSFYIPRQPAPSKCYRVNGVHLKPGVTVTFEDRMTELWPTTPQTPYIFSIEGGSMKSKARFTTIRGGELWAPFAMGEGTAGIRINYGDHVRLEDLFINGFYDDIFADNSSYLYLSRVSAHGALNANLWFQHSDVHHGPYFGGPLNVEQSSLNRCPCSAASIWVQDIAVVNISDSDVVGISQGDGVHASSSNGLPGSPPDYPDGIHLRGVTFDSIAGTPVSIHNYTNSDMMGTWISGGRPQQKSCMELDGVSEFSISDSHLFWCGEDGLVLRHTNAVKVTASNFSGTPHVGIHVINGVRSNIIGNSCQPENRNGNGSTTQRFCIYEEPPANGNRYLSNDATGTIYGNSFHGQGTINSVP